MFCLTLTHMMVDKCVYPTVYFYRPVEIRTSANTEQWMVEMLHILDDFDDTLTCSVFGGVYE